MTDKHTLIVFLGGRHTQREFKKITELKGGLKVKDPLQMECPPENTELERLWMPFKSKTYWALKRHRVTHVCLKKEHTRLLRVVKEVIAELKEKERIEIDIVTI